MSSCPSCGHTGQPIEHLRKHYRVGVCANCGTALVIGFDGGANQAATAPSIPPTTDTDAYQLTPTGPHAVVGSRGTASESRARASQEKQLRKILIICGSDELDAALTSVVSDAEREADILSVADSANGIEVFCKMVKGEHKPKLVLIDDDAGPIPSQDVARVIRLVEAGLDENRTPLLIVGRPDEAQAVKAVLGALGNARFVNKGHDAALDDQARRLLMLVDKILKRSK
ncbi:MAG: hypothetical protein VX589_02225 [Myxococcota bacterium]|nr:hypothetical protein [Myxococcota bacterium]